MKKVIVVTPAKPVKILKFKGDISVHGEIVNLDKYSEKESDMLDPYDPNYTEKDEEFETKASRSEAALFRKLEILQQQLRIKKIPFSIDNDMYKVTKHVSDYKQERWLTVEGGKYSFGTLRETTYSERNIEKFMLEVIKWYTK